jgi:putative oxidoreductase
MSQDFGKLLLRIMVGGLLLLHGLHKIKYGLGGVMSDLGARGLPTGIGYLVYLGEVVAPVLVLVGFMTRPAALVIAINMVMAIYLAHMGQIFSLGKSGAWGIELDAMYLFGAIAVACLGTGRYAVMGGMARWS